MIGVLLGVVGMNVSFGVNVLVLNGIGSSMFGGIIDGLGSVMVVSGM